MTDTHQLLCVEGVEPCREDCEVVLSEGPEKLWPKSRKVWPVLGAFWGVALIGLLCLGAMSTTHVFRAIAMGPAAEVQMLALSEDSDCKRLLKRWSRSGQHFDEMVDNAISKLQGNSSEEETKEEWDALGDMDSAMGNAIDNLSTWLYMDNDRYDPVNCSLNFGFSAMNVTYKLAGMKDALHIKKIALNTTRSHNFTWPKKCLDKLSMMVNLLGRKPQTRFCGHFNGGISVTCAVLEIAAPKLAHATGQCRKGSKKVERFEAAFASKCHAHLKCP